MAKSHTAKIIDSLAELAGSKAALAKKLDVLPQDINNWRNRGIPAERVLAVESATGVSRHKLRPDIFGESPLATVNG